MSSLSGPSTGALLASSGIARSSLEPQGGSVSAGRRLPARDK
jgi:hypothetical protein